MKRLNFPHIKGFENFPQGKLLRQVVDFDQPMGIAYERCIAYLKPTHTHDRFTVTFPRCAALTEMTMETEGVAYRLDNASVHLMPKNALHAQKSLSTIYDTFALFPDDRLVMASLDRHRFDERQKSSLLGRSLKIKRGAYLNEMVDRYFAYRVLGKSRGNIDLSTLEREILDEVFLVAAGKVPTEREDGHAEPSTALARALEYIESHLFSELSIDGIARHAKTSTASLFRSFRKELSLTPFAYVRHRRLDEAFSLLKTGNYQVSDVGILVGYDDLSAFSKAFKQQFGHAPSELLNASKS